MQSDGGREIRSVATIGEQVDGMSRMLEYSKVEMDECEQVGRELEQWYESNERVDTVRHESSSVTCVPTPTL